MLTCMAGPIHSYDPGHEYDLPAKEARRMIDAGFAIKAPEETETAEAPEHAVTGPTETRTRGK